MERRAFKINPIIINGKSIEEVIIDSHVDKHSDHISDELIINLKFYVGVITAFKDRRL